jgi:hypothetical protein
MTRREGSQGSAVRRETQPTSGGESADAQLIDALNGLDAGRSRALANRTRRAVHAAAVEMHESRAGNRRNSAIALAVLAGILMLLSPAIWNSVDELTGGEFVLDLPGMVAAMAFTLFAAIAAALFLIGGDRGAPHSRR